MVPAEGRGQPFFSIGINVTNPADYEDVAGAKSDGLARSGGDLQNWEAETLTNAPK